MSTTLNRGSTWTNSDGLVVGFGTNDAVVEGQRSDKAGDAGVKSASVTFQYTDTGVNVPVPAGAEIVGVKLKVDEAWAGGTAILVGDGADADGFVTATAGALAKLVAGALINADGLYTAGATDTTAREFKLYASADTIDVSYSGTFTAGSATIVVNYI